MTPRESVARAMAFFERSDDIALLHRHIEEIAPRARKLVTAFMARGGEDAIPEPADLHPAKEPAPAAEAAATLRKTEDFALLQVMARSIGRRIEQIEIAASAEFQEGSRVIVPKEARYPHRGAELGGSVEASGPTLRVVLDNGETWEGPASLARLARSAT